MTPPPQSAQNTQPPPTGPLSQNSVSSSVVLKSLSILLGVFFIFIGYVKISPFLSKDLHKDLVSGLSWYALHPFFFMYMIVTFRFGNPYSVLNWCFWCVWWQKKLEYKHRLHTYIQDCLGINLPWKGKKDIGYIYLYVIINLLGICVFFLLIKIDLVEFGIKCAKHYKFVDFYICAFILTFKRISLNMCNLHDTRSKKQQN